ncbi:MAG: serine protease [Microbacteriaceae bacterium]|nr:serine protease [Microbacteriaceae bacterium]
MTNTPEIPENRSTAVPPTPPSGGGPPTTPRPPGPRSEAPAQEHAATQPLAGPPISKPAGESFRRRRPVAIAAAIVAAALVGGVSGAGVTLLATSNDSGSAVSTATTPANVTVNDPDNATTVTGVAAKTAASVVTISVSSSDAGGTGSGVIISDDGYILTNTHVVTLDGAASDAAIKVQTNDGRLLTATLVGTDPTSDLAVIKVDDAGELSPAAFADSSKLNVGDTAIAIGAPLGLAGTVTDGIVSAINRSITIASSAAPTEPESESTTPDEGSPFDFWLPGQENQQAPTTSSSTISLAVIQTDAAINPGNSGGALLNDDGEVIGINVAIASAGGSNGSSAAGSIGVGFAIPANLAKRVSSEIIENGSATHGLLGASVVDVTEDADQADSSTVGASVKVISPGGAAEAAGLKVGDVITGINEVPVTGKTDLTAQVRALAAGAKATVSYVRDGKTGSAEVTLGTLE